MTTRSNYDSLLQGTINGKALNETRTEEVWAMGAPTLELWVNSWNASYPSDKLYISGDDTNGYYIGKTQNPTSADVGVATEEGYNNTLYFPHKNAVDNRCYGYWLASPSAKHNDYVMQVFFKGKLQYSAYGDAFFAFCPIVRLPSNILE